LKRYRATFVLLSMAGELLMKRPREKREAPYSLRLTFEERAKLNDNAGTMPVGSYIKSILFAEDAPKYRRRKSSPVKDMKALADVLAALGATRIANNLNQLAKATNIGNFYFDEDTKRDLKRACDDVRVMRQVLMHALGQHPSHEPRAPESTSQSFARAVKAKRFMP
jgi:hypothetical protein